MTVKQRESRGCPRLSMILKLHRCKARRDNVPERPERLSRTSCRFPQGYTGFNTYITFFPPEILLNSIRASIVDAVSIVDSAAAGP